MPYMTMTAEIMSLYTAKTFGPWMPLRGSPDFWARTHLRSPSWVVVFGPSKPKSSYQEECYAETGWGDSVRDFKAEARNREVYQQWKPWCYLAYGGKLIFADTVEEMQLLVDEQILNLHPDAVLLDMPRDRGGDGSGADVRA